MGDHMMGFFADALNLTDAQQDADENHHAEGTPGDEAAVPAGSRQIEQQLHQYAEGTFDEGKVRALSTQKAQVEAELTVQKTRIHNEMFQVLTADQQAKMKEIEANRESRMQNRMQESAPAAPQQ